MTRAVPTECARPSTVDRALAVRSAHPDWIVLAGGTDLMVPRLRPAAPWGVLDLFEVEELHRVTQADHLVTIGACTTYAELLDSGVVGSTLPLLHAAARDVGAAQIRARGTIGGNVMSSSPVGDLLPGLLALDAQVLLASATGHRTLPYERFVTGYRRVDLAPDELLVRVEVPVPAPGTVQRWRKVGTRAAQAVTKVSLAAAAHPTGGRVQHVRLALGGVADRPVRLHAVEELVEGAVPTADLVDAAGRTAATSLDPITDARSTADYRLDVAARLIGRFVAELADLAGRR